MREQRRYWPYGAGSRRKDGHDENATETGNKSRDDVKCWK